MTNGVTLTTFPYLEVCKNGLNLGCQTKLNDRESCVISTITAIGAEKYCGKLRPNSANQQLWTGGHEIHVASYHIIALFRVFGRAFWNAKENDCLKIIISPAGW